MLTVLDLFSGIGGISLGLESTGGFRTVAFCEIEPFPREVLRKHWPGVPIHEDVTKLRGSEVGAVDMICGGFPCQDVSVAGKGAGLDGKRSGLWSEYARLVGELRPRWVVAENVGALRTRGVDRVCSDLEGEGYSVWPLLVGAWAVGAPHKRERVWIVAHRQGGRDWGRVADPGDAAREQRERAWRARPTAPVARGGGSALAHGDEQCLTDGGGRRSASLSRASDRAGSGQPSDGGDADGRGERPVGDTQHDDGRADQPGRGAEGRTTARRSGPQLSQPEGERRAQQGNGRDAGSRLGRHAPAWPARPGEPQHEWEEPRLVGHSNGGKLRRHPAQLSGRESRREGSASGHEGHGGESRHLEQQVGGAVDGLPERLVRAAERRARRANREALKALGNSVVPHVVQSIGFAILAADGLTA